MFMIDYINDDKDCSGCINLSILNLQSYKSLSFIHDMMYYSVLSFDSYSESHFPPSHSIFPNKKFTNDKADNLYSTYSCHSKWSNLKYTFGPFLYKKSG